ncbi:MAG: hypothetical protein ACOX6E_06185 [Syntrophomonadaceae bacterium]|jgi:TRAP-type C4-dicarboxylate transport system substrate-binding protein
MAVFLMLAVLIAGCSTQTPDSSSNDKSNASTTNSDTIKIRAAGAMPPKHGFMVGYHMPWIERVEKETNGRVKFDVYPSQELVPNGGEITALEAKTMDMALNGLRAYHPELFPMADVSMLPAKGADTIVATKAWIDLMESDVPLKDGKTYYQLEFEDNGFVGLPMPAQESCVICLAKKEVKNVSDFNGLIMRGTGRAHELLISNLNGTPVTMTAPELYDALSRGTIDGILFSIADWPGYSFQDVLKYNIIGLDMGNYAGDNMFLKETWESYPQDVRDIMMKAAKEQAIKGAEHWKSLTEPTKKESMEKGAVFVNFNELPAETQQHLEKAMVQTWHDWIDKVNESGAPGLECAKLWRDLIIKHGATVPDEIMNL